ncbi:Asp-tRNA(Asn)/Glu-tRNA(Gln) amidotransferase subunit GatB [Candidatus Parcubacteria bacterium]|nr:Asp-tRNA(Asn)/Glu-tRNA(Gln) amidotransferase subunit GatB [Candidatus Parcubacteria bacterium]
MKPRYIPTIGLEVHAELKTATKMFCSCKNDPDERRPNVNICPICMAHPGTLPAMNEAAVRHVVRVGQAVGGATADFTEFDRKNYFYPDIPKGYQISQYQYPLVQGGELNGIALTRVHLEEDTARSQHDKGNHSLIDFNRAGVPLMELVTEPVVASAEAASAFAKELQLLLRTLGASDANMEKGEMRVEANISVGEEGKRGTKVEVKNLNSFKVVEKAIRYEIERQSEALDRGEKVVQETRGWDEAKEETFSQREKESSHDYRYFPDPDLPKLKLSEVPFANEQLPELPWERRARYEKKFSLRSETATLFVNEQRLGDYFDSLAHACDDKRILQLAANYIASDIVKLPKFPPAKELTLLMGMAVEGIISSAAVKLVLPELLNGKGAEDIVAAKGLKQKSDEGALAKIAEKIVAENAKAAAEYRAGKEASLKFLVGQGMKESKGSANPKLLEEALKRLLS